MLVAALFRRIHIPVDVSGFLFNGLLVHIEKLHGVLFHTDDLFIFNEIYIPGILQYRRHIRRDDASVLCVPNDQRAVLADRIELLWMIFEHDPKGIRPLHTMHDLDNRLKGIALIIVIQKMGDHFRVRIRHKLISLRRQLLFQLQIIFDNSVMYYDNALIRVKMRMRVHIRRLPVCCPAGMADSHMPRKYLPVMGQFTEYF